MPRTASAPARRLLSDSLRHDLGLTGTHVGCEHGVCGACTVLVDGAAGALLPDVRGHGAGPRDHHRRGRSATTPAALGPVQQAFRECHGLQCGFCTPGFLTTITAYLDENPDPTPDEAREAIAGNLCRCTGYQNIVKPSVLRAAEIRRERAGAARRPGPAEAEVAHDHPAVRRSRSSASRTRGCSPARAATSTTSATTRSRRRSCAARTPTPGSSTSTSTDALDVDGVVAIYTYEDLDRPGRPSRCRC